jgi:hypothetical protein
LRPLFDYWGGEIKRFYKLETLASAVSFMIESNRDRFIIASAQQLLGPSPISTLAFELFQEGKFQLIFKLRVCNEKRKEAAFAFVVAKHHEAYSRIAQAELGNLHTLHERAPGVVVRPFRGGLVFLPDRHGRTSHGREVYAYLTQWLDEYQELGVNRTMQFYVNIAKPHTFSIAQTELIKSQMVETIARSYDPVKRDCMEMPQVASGDFVVTDPAKGAPKIKLIACRRMLPHMTPAKLLHSIIGASWEWCGQTFRIFPSDPELLFEGVVKAFDRETARDWFDQYVRAIQAGRLKEQEVFPLDLAKSFLS